MSRSRSIPLVGTALIIIASILVSAESSQAFDGHRSGFQLGFGGGAGHAGLLESGRPSHTGFTTTLKIGGGFNDRWSLSYYGPQLWDLFDDETGTVAFPMIAVTHYRSETAPSHYIGACFGPRLSLSWAFAGNRFWPIGGGLAGGAFYGYEFARHYSVELLGIYGSALGSNGLWQLSISINALAF